MKTDLSRRDIVRAGVLTLWRRSEGEHRTRLSEFVVQSMQPEWAGAVECLVGILRETKEEDAPVLREQVLNKVRTTNRRAAIPALSEWALYLVGSSPIRATVSLTS